MAYIHRTPAGAGSSTVFTLSYWVKRAKLGAIQTLYSAGSANKGKFVFNAEDQLEVSDDGSDVVKTTRVFRDVGAWYHIVLAYDTGESGTDKVKIYVNGVQETAYATDNRSTAGSLNYVNAAEPQYIGADPSSPFYGVMAHVQMVDGAQLAPTEFGEFDSTSGIWKLKTSCYATPGTNGFCLKMEDSSNLDLDSSSNAFTFTTSGTLTATKDNPDNNFCTLTPLTRSKGTIPTLSYGNTTTQVSDSWSGATVAIQTGKWYWEMKQTVGLSSAVGVIRANDGNQSGTNWIPNLAGTYGMMTTNGDKVVDGSQSSYDSQITANDILMFAMDATAGSLYVGINGTWLQSSNPATDTSPMISSMGVTSTDWWVPFATTTSAFSAGAVCNFNFGNGYFATTAVTSGVADADGEGTFEYTPPTGYYALCTNNLATYG